MSYLPAGSPLVMTIATDPNGAAIHGVNGLLAQFPFASLGIGAAKQKLQQSGINYDADLRPLFGNPIAIAVSPPPVAKAGSVTSASGTNALVVWITKDGDKLKSLIAKAGSGVKRSGTHDGATLYEDGSSGAFAIDGSTLVVGPSTASVTAALDRHKSGGGMTASQLKSATSALPQAAVITMFGDIGGLLNSQGMSSARQVPWVSAIHSYSEAITASSSGLKVNYHVDTSGAQLTDAQVPFAPGTTAPALAGQFPVTVGIHDPAHIARFAESAEQAANPATYTKFQAQQAALRAKTGVDLNSLVDLLTGDLIIASDLHTTMARVSVTDPAAAAHVLDKLATHVKGNTLRRTANGWAFVSKRSVVPLILVGDQLVVGKATVPALRSFAAAPTTPAPDAHGSVAFRIRLSQLLGLALHSSSASVSQAAGAVLRQLTDISGSSSVSTSALSGDATLGVR